MTVSYTHLDVYKRQAQFRWVEDFETGNSLTELNDNSASDTSLIRITDPSKVYEGGGSGQIILSSTHTTSESINNRDITIKQGEGFIEVN